MKKWLLVLLGLLLVVGLAACSRGEIPYLTEEDLGPVEEEEEPEPEPAILNPLNNLPVESEEDLEMRVVVVSIDNYRQARPQAGISTADLMYEVPAEGGISRLLAVFYASVEENIGPVRSARPYMVDIAREWQGMFVHCGGSDDALNYLAQGHVNWLNEIAQGSYFWRQSGRSAPHNLFTSTEQIYRYLENREWALSQEPRGFLFYEEDERMNTRLEKADLVHIHYPYAKNEYVYDAATGLYARSIGDEPHIDANNDAQVQASNIIVQRVSSRVLDNVGRLSINMVGEGEALLFTAGTVQEGSWKRADIDSPTYFYGAGGQEWQLNSGQTWIQVCDGDVKISYEDSTAPQEEEGGE